MPRNQELLTEHFVGLSFGEIDHESESGCGLCLFHPGSFDRRKCPARHKHGRVANRGFEPAELAKRWGHGDTNAAHNVITVDEKQTRQGKASIRLDTNAGFDNWVYFPNTKDLDIDLSRAETVRGYMRSENKNGWGGDPWIIFVNMAGAKARFDGEKHRLRDAMSGWSEVAVPVGGDLEAKCKKLGWKPKIDPAFDWKHVACVQLHQDTDGYGYIMWYSGFEFVGQGPIRWWLSSLDQPDIAVTFAEQVPQYRRNFPTEPDPKYNIPELVGKEANVKHWPNPGEKIKYLVHVQNAGFAPSKPTDFVCTIDGEVVKRTELPSLAPKQKMIVEVPWTWKQGPYEFVAEADTENKMCEITKKNNKLEFRTDAYALVAVCEKRIVDPIEQVNNWYGSFCFEDWMRGATIDQLNRMFRRCKYDFAPRGAEIAVRLGNIVMVNRVTDASGESVNKTLDLSPYDGTWHYDLRALDEWCDLANDFDWALNHELTHQLGIIDDYRYDLGPENNMVNHRGYDRGPGGIMGGGEIGDNEYPAYAAIDVAAFNLTRGHRRGFYGEYLYCIPKENILRLTLRDKPLANQAIEIYQRTINSEKLEGPAVFIGQTDSKGEFPLPNRPVPKTFTTATGCTLHPNPFGYPDVVGRNGLFMVRTKLDGQWYYGFVNIGRFVCEYARGHKDLGTYSIKLLSEKETAPKK